MVQARRERRILVLVGELDFAEVVRRKHTGVAEIGQRITLLHLHGDGTEPDAWNDIAGKRRVICKRIANHSARQQGGKIAAPPGLEWYRHLPVGAARAAQPLGLNRGEEESVVLAVVDLGQIHGAAYRAARNMFDATGSYGRKRIARDQAR